MAQWPGDAHRNKVISTHEETLETAEKTVLETYIRQSWSLVHIWIDGQKTSVTPNHPYWVSGKGWVEAGDLTGMEQLRNPDGDLVSIQRIEHEVLAEPVNVYNFQVEDFHTYYAGDVSVLVHNTCAPQRPSKGVIKTEVNKDGSVTYTKLINGQEVRVTYSPQGYADFALADKAAGFTSSNPRPAGTTWHHVEDMSTMILVNSSIHNASIGGFAHTGGVSIWQQMTGMIYKK